MKSLMKSIMGKSMVLTMILSVGLLGGAAFADNTAHWSDHVVDKWSNLGYIELDQAGNFNPDQGITRKEFVRLVNKTFGYTDMSPLAFKDVEKDNPYYLDILAARE
ncbi:MAG: S-layer homology domain-containing protein, partial [Firmicutes bacterium]|nr:S-layer homology domain-containing protein [Bacillota bacterium]